MSRIDQINSLLLKELATLAEQEVFLKDGLITISYVECSPDLRHAKIGVSVLPDDLTEIAIKKLSRKSALFSVKLKKKIKIKYIPKFHWVADEREKNAAVIEDTLNEIYGKK
jgi:ribosome-binding factor A